MMRLALQLGNGRGWPLILLPCIMHRGLIHLLLGLMCCRGWLTGSMLSLISGARSDLQGKVCCRMIQWIPSAGVGGRRLCGRVCGRGCTIRVSLDPPGCLHGACCMGLSGLAVPQSGSIHPGTLPLGHSLCVGSRAAAGHLHTWKPSSICSWSVRWGRRLCCGCRVCGSVWSMGIARQ